MSDTEKDLPNEVSDGEPGLFDRFADRVSRVTAKAWFFTACVALVIVWAPSFLVVPDIDTWQLLINTPTTVVTFLLVGLMQNSAARTNAATQQKLNAIARSLLDPMDTRDLEEVVGLEDREGS
jgi:low affinity Fe/Cu permease